jgi:hypothetical protein
MGRFDEHIEFVATQCCYCRHRIGHEGQTCNAFPRGIPDSITRNQVDHRKVYPGDNGIGFEFSAGIPETVRNMVRDELDKLLGGYELLLSTDPYLQEMGQRIGVKFP